MNRIAGVVALALALVPAFALAQEPGHEHMAGAGMAVVLHDGPENGRAVVGDYAHFGFALLNASMPQVHRNAQFRVVQDGVTVFATNDTHEYDGLFSFDYRFTQPGPYTVTASSEGMMDGTFSGVAVMPVNATVAKVVAKVEPQSDARLVKVTLSIVDAAGNLIPHTDAIVEFRDVGAEDLVARFHVHIHDAPIVFTEALPPNDVTMGVVAYRADPSGKSPDVQAVYAAFPVKGDLGTPDPTQAAMPHAPAPLEPLGAKAEKGGYTLWASYDPEPQIAPGSTVRLVGTILNASGMPQPHVDFDYTVFGPEGLLFQSKSFHEYDGVAEYEVQPFVPGFYDGTITAHAPGGDVTVPLRFEVVPPAVAALPGDVATGPFMVSVKGLDKAQAGMPTDLTFDVSGPQGPSQHSEVDVTIGQKDQPPLYNFKLHTHESGQTHATVVFPSDGDWRVRIDPLPTAPEPVVYVGPNGPNAPILFTAKVTGAAPGDVSVKPLSTSGGARTVPAVGALAVVALAAAVALLARRR